jgi:glycosyltransferase involved in cell wall biosynthesis
MGIHKKIIVVMPAYNAELTLEKTFKDIPKGIVNEIILTDDCSSDKTVEIAKKLGISVLTHNKNIRRS